MNRQRIILVALIVLFLATLLGEATISLLTDWWWFSAVGFKSIFTKIIGSRILLFFIFDVFFLLFFSINLHAVTKRGGGRWREFYSDLPIPGESLERIRRLILIGISLLMAMALGMWAS